MEAAVDGERDSVVERAKSQLGIDDPERLQELSDLAEIIAWISAGIRRAQEARPSEPPPALRFMPERTASDFWRGPHRAE
jgi:hypothetical protein